MNNGRPRSAKYMDFSRFFEINIVLFLDG